MTIDTQTIEIQDLQKVYRSAKTETTALAGVDLTLGHNEFISIIGPSGCGKTTMLKIIAGLVEPSAGEVRINGQAVRGPGPERAVVFQNFALMPWATALENVEFGLEMKGLGKRERRELAREQLAVVGLAGFEDRLPKELSGGMQQRVGIARALAVNPDILLMDEPFGAVDAQTRQLLQEDLLDVWQRHPKTVVFITHSMDEAVYLSDKIVIMQPHPGRISEVLTVDLPRPRGPEVRQTAEFGRLTNYIWERLREDVRREVRQ